MRLFLLLAAGLSSAPKSADWPEFRGPTAQGVYADGALPTEWSDTKNVVWKQPMPGKGWSSPVAADGRIYLTAAVPVEGGKDGDLSLQALCLDGNTGSIRWAKEVFREGPSDPQPALQEQPRQPDAARPRRPPLRPLRPHGHGLPRPRRQRPVAKQRPPLRPRPRQRRHAGPRGRRASSSAATAPTSASSSPSTAGDGRVLWKKDRTEHPQKGFSFGTPLVITVGGRKQVVSTGQQRRRRLRPQDRRGDLAGPL